MGYSDRSCKRPEYVGSVPYGDTIGLVVANFETVLHKALNFPDKYRSIGIVSSRSGAGPQLMAADEAVKACNAELIMFELANDAKGGGTHGCILVFGAEEVADARRAVEITLQSLEWAFGGVYDNGFGYVECQFSARASQVLHDYSGAELGKPYGLIVGFPAAIGVVISDVALKTADVKFISYASPSGGTQDAYPNEFSIVITGDSGAVKQAVITARDVAIELLRTYGTEPVIQGKAYY